MTKRLIATLLISILLLLSTTITASCTTILQDSEPAESNKSGKWERYPSLEDYKQTVYYYHDAEKMVGIWLVCGASGTSIYVVPDKDYIERG